MRFGTKVFRVSRYQHHVSLQPLQLSTTLIDNTIARSKSYMQLTEPNKYTLARETRLVTYQSLPSHKRVILKPSWASYNTCTFTLPGLMVAYTHQEMLRTLPRSGWAFPEHVLSPCWLLNLPEISGVDPTAKFPIDISINTMVLIRDRANTQLLVNQS